MKSGWQMTVRGRGPIYDGSPVDADAMTKRFVQELADKGHTIEHATIQPTEAQQIKPHVSANASGNAGAQAVGAEG